MNYYQEHQSEFLEGLKAFLRIPSISTLPENKPDIRRAADFALNELRAAGMTAAELIEDSGGGNPLVYAEWLGAPGQPTILFYGHYDVQPPDPLDEWKSPPFEPEVRGDNIFARGACDDKGQVYIQIKAVEGLLKTTGKLPVNVKFLLEGEEETGGEHIEAYVKSQAAAPAGRCRGGLRHRDVRARAAHHLRRPARPGLLRAARAGRRPRPAFRRLRRRRAQPHHGDRRDPDARSRTATATSSSPASTTASCRPAEKEREAWARLPFDEKEYTEKEMGASELVGEPGVPLFERLWARPTLEVHGIRGGFTGDGAKTVIPARAVAKISTRLVGDQRVDEVHRADAGRGESRLSQGRHRRVEGAAYRRTLADQPRQSLHPRGGPGAAGDVRPGDGLHPLAAAPSRSWASSTATWESPA